MRSARWEGEGSRADSLLQELDFERGAAIELARLVRERDAVRERVARAERAHAGAVRAFADALGSLDAVERHRAGFDAEVRAGAEQREEEAALLPWSASRASGRH